MYIIELYAYGESFPSDCDGQFYATWEEADKAGPGAVAVCSEWAERYTIRDCDDC